MPKTIVLVNHRKVILKMMLELMRVYCTAYFGPKNFGTCAADLMLLAAVAVGQTEGRPLNASKISDFAGIPRPTVIRKMASMERSGLVTRNGAAFTVRLDVVNGQTAVDATLTAIQEIVKAAGELSKLDTKPIASRPS